MSVACGNQRREETLEESRALASLAAARCGRPQAAVLANREGTDANGPLPRHPVRHCGAMAGRANPRASSVGGLANRLVEAYLAHAASLMIARSADAATLIPDVEADQLVPVGRLLNGDGTPFEFHFSYFFEVAGHPTIAEDFDRTYAAGALLALGDALAAQHYFDRAPELELVRHLRNGVAHGNRFNIQHAVQLTTHPANNFDAWVKTSPLLEVTPAAHGRTVLFDFVAPADVVGVLQGVAAYLIRMGTGEPLR